MRNAECGMRNAECGKNRRIIGIILFIKIVFCKSEEVVKLKQTENMQVKDRS